MQSQAEHITQMLGAVRKGDQAAANQLMEAVYSDLRVIARGHFSRERPDHTLQPTALVHEAWLRIFSGSGSGAEIDWRDRSHFYAVAARQMRRILIDRGREFRADKRGAGLKVSFDDAQHSAGSTECGIDEIADLLDRLQRTDPEAAQVVEMKFFGGMTDEEVASEMGCAHSTVRRHWSFARAWLKSRLESSAR